MLSIPCPWCGSRDEREFSFGGEADRNRPRAPELLDDEAWANYLFARRNLCGAARYRVCHSTGCGMWFSLQFDTRTHAAVEPRPLDGNEEGETP